MEGQIESFVVPEAAESEPCIVEYCDQRAAAEVGTCHFCIDHLLSTSFQELQSSHEGLKAQVYDPAAITSFKGLLAAWARQVQAVAVSPRLPDQHIKARLLDALLWVSQADKSLRRSPRLATAVPVWLRREDSYRTWEEDTWTSTVSRHGAAFACRHPVDTGGTVVLVRKGKGGRAGARVVYSHMDSEGRRQIGVELIDRDDFWE